MHINLPYKKIDLLPVDTHCYQLQDGTVFYFKSSSPQHLYVKNASDREISATLTYGMIIRVAAHGNEIFFNTADGKIYKAVHKSVNTITVTFVRYLLGFEHVTSTGLCNRIIDGKKLTYRMCDVPDRFTLIDLSATRQTLSAWDGWALLTIHREKALFIKQGQTEIRRLNKNTIGLILPLHSLDTCTAFAQDSSSLIYISDGHHSVFVLDMDKMEAVMVAYFGDISQVSIVGAVNGMITAIGRDSGEAYLITAKSTYLENKVDRTQYSEAFDCLEKKYVIGIAKKPESAEKTRKAPAHDPFNDFDESFKKGQREREMNRNVNQLLDRNMELTEEVERLQLLKLGESNEDQEAVRELRSSNSEIEKAIELLEIECREVNENLDRTATLNDELEAANDQLTEETEKLKEQVTEMDKTINELRAKNTRLIQEKEQIKKNKNEKVVPTVDVLDANKELKKQLEALLKANENLSMSLAGRSGEDEISTILSENQQIIGKIMVN